MEWTGFAMSWRFLDPRYNLLPEIALDRIHPLSIEESRRRWKDWVSVTYDHLMAGVRHTGNIGPEHLIMDDCGWGDREKELLLKEHLAGIMGLEGNEPVTFFWGGSQAAETEWGVFLEYWSDFCYPSDDSNVIIFHEDSRAMIYVEDRIWVVDRRGFFGSHED